MFDRTNILTISQLNQTVANVLETEIPVLWIKGEIASFTCASSGHWYLSLKDMHSTVKAVMFRQRNAAVNFTPKVGDQLELRVKVMLYAPRGDYQLQIEAMRHSGQGDLYEAFILLKEKLRIAGLFDSEGKLSVPRYPKKIGVVTSLKAAALQDVITTLQRRVPYIPVVVYPSMVQGQEAVGQLIQALNVANQRAEVDVLLLVRGGGSLEDLWCFNDERLAYAISQSSIPIMTGIGHETDVTIADFVASVRAPTPTAAAEMVAVDRQDLMNRVMHLQKGLIRQSQRQLVDHTLKLDAIAVRLMSPGQRLRQQQSRLGQLKQSLGVFQHQYFKDRRYRLMQMIEKIRYQQPPVVAISRYLSVKQNELIKIMRTRLLEVQTHVAHLETRLHAMSPQQTLDRGYAIVRDRQGCIIRQVNELQLGDNVRVDLAQGSLDVQVVNLKPNSKG